MIRSNRRGADWRRGGEGVWPVVTQVGVTGPNVVLNFTSTTAAASALGDRSARRQQRVHRRIRPAADGNRIAIPDSPSDTHESPGVPVIPASLYLAQLRDRLGEHALRNIGR